MEARPTPKPAVPQPATPAPAAPTPATTGRPDGGSASAAAPKDLANELDSLHKEVRDILDILERMERLT